ncbi:MAG: hypothetical protein M1576_02085 [Deltaproteobacteria bacterium]|nr:hypothetical protein [Deltaproteobacteria bacterium]
MKNYIIKKGENKYSPFAGTKLISDMINKLNMEDLINKTLTRKISPKISRKISDLFISSLLIEFYYDLNYNIYIIQGNK